MRVDRGNDTVVALLDDGTVDRAPNLIAPYLQLPETIAGVMRDDWKILAVCGAVATGLGALLMAAAVAFGTAADPALLDMLSHSSY